MLLKTQIELLGNKNIKVDKYSIKELTYWSDHNIYVYINLICHIENEKLNKK